MEPRIEIISDKKIVGKHSRMKLSQNKTFELWRSFMPVRKTIKHSLSIEMLSIQIYDEALDYKRFTMETEFEKWAGIEVSEFANIPEGMESLLIKGGLFAVFLYKGNPNDFADTFHYIFGNWLPNSDYETDHRPHFEILGEKYKNNDPSSEEEIWIPIKQKNNSL